MLKNFFKLNSDFEVFDVDRFRGHLKTSKSFQNIRYEPDELSKEKINSVTFENVSFSKTAIREVTFTNCKFSDCLFIGSTFQDVELHHCSFVNCNFYKVDFQNLYAKPIQFRKAIIDPNYANIAVHLYHKLRENYYRESQREFKNEAEYMFSRWNRINAISMSKRHSISKYKYYPPYILSYAYDILFGYGYRVRNLIITTLFTITGLISLNSYFSSLLFDEVRNTSLIETVYFTVTTMTTLGASGYSPNTDLGYLFVMVNVIVGVTLFSATISAIFKKLMR